MNKNCTTCGTKMVWEHPQIPGKVMESSCEVEDWPICHECMVEHCVHTDCKDCTYGKYPDCRFKELKEHYTNDLILNTPDFQHRDTGIPVYFIWNVDKGLLTLELCEPLIDSWNLREETPDAVDETAELVKSFRPKKCDTAADANTYIKQSFPDAWRDGICFQEDGED